MPQLGWSTLFKLIAFVLFLLAALASGGVIGLSGGVWLVAGGLASLTLAFLIP